MSRAEAAGAELRQLDPTGLLPGYQEKGTARVGALPC